MGNHRQRKTKQLAACCVMKVWRGSRSTTRIVAVAIGGVAHCSFYCVPGTQCASVVVFVVASVAF